MNWLGRRILSMGFRGAQKVSTNLAKVALAESFNKILCINQGKLIQYSYLAGEKHRLFKEAATENKDLHELHSYHEDLCFHLRNGLKEACTYNFQEAIRLYTRDRGRRLLPHPRIGLKVHDYDRGLRKQFITTTWGTPYYNLEGRCQVDENTASQRIHQYGDHYLNNNIPESVKAKRYINPRLDLEKTRQYMSCKGKMKYYGRLVGQIAAKQRIDYEWLDCWKNDLASEDSAEPTPEQCYKSTLVVPLTLKNNPPAEPFLVTVREKGQSTNFFHPDDERDPIDVVKRHVYGYFCVDHQHANYFDEDYDRAIGYFFADILSLYLFVELTYTKLSTTFVTKYRRPCPH